MTAPDRIADSLERIADTLDQIAANTEPRVTHFSGPVDGISSKELSERLNRVEGGLNPSGLRNPDRVHAVAEPVARAGFKGATQGVKESQDVSVGVAVDDVSTSGGLNYYAGHDSSPSVGSGTSSVGEAGTASLSERGGAQ